MARLDLDVEFVSESEPDYSFDPPWPVLRLLIDGEDQLAHAWEGMGRDPDALLREDSPLVPPPTGSQDVRLYRCTCGEEGCGSLIARVRYDGSDVVWDAFRDGSDITFEGDPVEGLSEVRFDRTQYVEAVRNAHKDRAWESTQRRAARFVRERLESQQIALPRGWKFEGAGSGVSNYQFGSANRHVPGVSVVLSRDRQQIVVGFEGDTSDPTAFADRVISEIQHGDPQQWPITFRGGSIDYAREDPGL